MTDFDSPSRLELLRFARKVVLQQASAALQQIDGWIAQEERREAEKGRGLERRPAPPEWLVQFGLNRKNLDGLRAHPGLLGRREEWPVPAGVPGPGARGPAAPGTRV